MSFTTLILKPAAKVLAIIAISFSYLATAGVNTETDANDVILAGHDAVAYFTEGKPVMGSAELTVAYNGAIYRFSSVANRDKFSASPSQYAPQYGGYCAYGMTFGKKFEIDGKAFEVVDGKLFVNKNRDVYQAWKKDVPTHIGQADAKWPMVENVAASKL